MLTEVVEEEKRNEGEKKKGGKRLGIWLASAIAGRWIGHVFVEGELSGSGTWRDDRGARKRTG
jgi:hypothetical protein